MQILVTGGAGFIGSHTVVELVLQNHEVVIIDNLTNSSRDVVERIDQITGQNIPFYEVDCRDKHQLDEIFKTYKFDAVMHFAGLKAVGESVSEPIKYYRNNIDSTLALLEVMQDNEVKNMIFSSSATVYGTPKHLPIAETQPTGIGITNPYGQTKFMIEQILQDLAVSDNGWRISLLRYFNPIGAHASGLIGESPNGLPNNLMPYIAKVAAKELPRLNVYGGDYYTVDGTGIRDYIHVVDLARGHVAALNHLSLQIKRVESYNLGTGKGTSVLELVKTFVQSTGATIPYSIVKRRPGDVPACYADVTKANRELNWVATKTLREACSDAWLFKQELSRQTLMNRQKVS